MFNSSEFNFLKHTSQIQSLLWAKGTWVQGVPHFPAFLGPGLTTGIPGNLQHELYES